MTFNKAVISSQKIDYVQNRCFTVVDCNENRNLYDTRQYWVKNKLCTVQPRYWNHSYSEYQYLVKLQIV